MYEWYKQLFSFSDVDVFFSLLMAGIILVAVIFALFSRQPFTADTLVSSEDASKAMRAELLASTALEIRMVFEQRLAGMEAVVVSFLASQEGRLQSFLLGEMTEGEEYQYLKELYHQVSTRVTARQRFDDHFGLRLAELHQRQLAQKT